MANTKEILKNVNSEKLNAAVESILDSFSGMVGAEETVISVPIKRGETYTVEGAKPGSEITRTDGTTMYPVLIILSNGSRISAKHFAGIEDAPMGASLKEIATWVASHNLAGTKFLCVRAKKSSGTYGAADYEPSEYIFEVA